MDTQLMRTAPHSPPTERVHTLTGGLEGGGGDVGGEGGTGGGGEGGTPGRGEGGGGEGASKASTWTRRSSTDSTVTPKRCERWPLVVRASRIRACSAA